MAVDEPDNDAPTGDVVVYVLGESGEGYEVSTAGSPFAAAVITPIQNDTVYKQFSINPQFYDNFKISVDNESDVNLTISVRIKTATIPLAS